MPGKVKLTFDKSKDSTAIATVTGGEYNKDVLYLQTGDGKVTGKKGVRELEIGKHRLSKLSPRKQSEVMRVLQEAFKKGIPPEHLNLGVDGAEDAYREMIGEVEEKGSSKIKLPPGSTFSLNFSSDPEKRFIYYIAGASGSGKSYVAKHLSEQYQKMFDRPVYLVSKLKEDATLDGMAIPPIRLNIDKLVEKPMADLEPLRESLVIFDDYDTLQGKDAKAVQQLIDDICIMGRHTTTSILILTHHLSNFKKTRLCLTESTHFVVYPQSTGAHALNYFLKTYVGMGPKEVQAIKNTGSRWLCIHKNFPIYYVT
jgi:hypothetical protein